MIAEEWWSNETVSSNGSVSSSESWPSKEITATGAALGDVRGNVIHGMNVPGVRVLIVDDHVIVRDGLAQLLATADGVEVVGFAADGRAAVEAVAALHPDVVLMDLSMPVMEGVEATALITQQSPATKVVILTSFSEQHRVVAAVAAGAKGYVLKHAEPEQILAAIEVVRRGGIQIDPQVASALLDFQRHSSARRGKLTTREEDVLRLVHAGVSNKQIATRLEISEHTVKAHLTKIFQSLGVTDRTQAALWAAENLAVEG